VNKKVGKMPKPQYIRKLAIGFNGGFALEVPLLEWHFVIVTYFCAELLARWVYGSLYISPLFFHSST